MRHCTVLPVVASGNHFGNGNGNGHSSNARKGCTKASPLPPQQKRFYDATLHFTFAVMNVANNLVCLMYSVYVKAFLVWSICTLGGWLSIDTEVSHIIPYPTISTTFIVH
jgi:hypothetical protein